MTHTELPVCPTEDSNECYWDATIQGNGLGTSFVNYDGVTTYLDVPADHYILGVGVTPDNVPSVAYQEYDAIATPNVAYTVDFTLPIVIVAAAVIASIAIVVTAFVKRAR